MPLHVCCYILRLKKITFGAEELKEVELYNISQLKYQPV
jgi:hypothetical protein